MSKLVAHEKMHFSKKEMDKIRYTLLFFLLFINCIYVYGAVTPRIIIIILLSWLVWSSPNRTSYSHRFVASVSICFLLSFIIGLINNPSLVLGESKYLVFLYAYILIMCYKWNQNKVFNFLFIISLLVNITIIGITFLYFMGVDIDRPYFPGSSFVVRENSVGYSIATFQSLSFFLVFNIIYFINKKDLMSMIPCVLGLINVFTSDRRAIILFPTLVSLLYVFFFYKGKDIKRFLIYFLIIVLSLIVVLAILSNLLGIDLAERFSKAFELITYDDDSDDVRVKQFKALMDKFLESPLLGNGLGAYAESYIRDPEIPYAYELTYIASLMKYGLFGFTLIYGGYIVTLIKICRKNIGDIRLHAIIGGVISLLLVSVTNPYINVSLLLLLTIVFVWNKKSEITPYKS